MIFFLLRVECHGTLQQRDFFLRTLEHWPTPTLAILVGLNIIAIMLITHSTIVIIINAIIFINMIIVILLIIRKDFLDPPGLRDYSFSNPHPRTMADGQPLFLDQVLKNI